jgi:hypothetical protein
MTYTQPGRSLKSVYDAASNGDILGTVGAIGSGIWDNSSTGQTLNNFREGSQLAAGASERYANKFLGDHTDSSRAIGDTMATRHGVSQGVAPYAGGGSPIGMAVGTGITEGANASEGVIAPWRDRILGKANDAVARRTGFNAVDKVFKPFNEVMTGASGWWNGTEKELAKPIVTQQAAPTSPAPASSAPAPTPPTPAPVFQRPTPTNTTTAAQPSKPATGTNVATAAPNTSNLKSRMSKLQNSGNLQNAFVKKTY